MTDKHFAIIFCIVLVIGVGFLAYTQMMVGGTPQPSPTASSDDLFENNQTGTQQTQNQMQQQTQPTQAKKQYGKAPSPYTGAELSNKKAVLNTTKGVIEFEIFPDSPMAASNFIFLTQDKFYDGLVFHRVESWVVQGGDPTGTGMGGPGYKFNDEPVTKEYTRGIVAMANSGPNTNGSQFFILTRDTPLPPSYTIFGQVTTGMDVVDQIKVGDKMNTVVIESK